MVMQQTSNRQIIENERDELVLNTSTDLVPRTIVGNIQPVFEVNRKIGIIRSVSRATTGASTIYTTPSDRDFFLAQVFLSYMQDVSGSGTSVFVQIVQDGVTYYVLLPKLTLTATTRDINVTFPIPIKVDRGTTIVMNVTFAAGACTAHSTISGYLMPPSTPQTPL